MSKMIDLEEVIAKKEQEELELDIQQVLAIVRYMEENRERGAKIHPADCGKLVVSANRIIDMCSTDKSGRIS